MALQRKSPIPMAHLKPSKVATVAVSSKYGYDSKKVANEMTKTITNVQQVIGKGCDKVATRCAYCNNRVANELDALSGWHWSCRKVAMEYDCYHHVAQAWDDYCANCGQYARWKRLREDPHPEKVAGLFVPVTISQPFLPPDTLSQPFTLTLYNRR